VGPVRAGADDRHLVDAHRPPTPPLLQELTTFRLTQKGCSAAAQRIESGAIEALAVTGKFHRAAEPVASAPAGHAHRWLAQGQRTPRRQRGSVIGQGIALAWLLRTPVMRVRSVSNPSTRAPLSITPPSSTTRRASSAT